MSALKKVTAIIAAAGSGKRLNLKTAKPFVKINNKELILRTIDIFEKSLFIDNIVIAVDKKVFSAAEKLINKQAYKKPITLVCGGAMRSQSVFNALCAVNKTTDIVVIHDVARPFLTQDVLKRCIMTAKKNINCIAAVPAKDTIKNIDVKTQNIKHTPCRKELWQAQTPQVFKRETLEKAYRALNKKTKHLTDDASILETAGQKIKVVMGDYSNIKITTREDLKVAEILLKNDK